MIHCQGIQYLLCLQGEFQQLKNVHFDLQHVEVHIYSLIKFEKLINDFKFNTFCVDSKFALETVL